MNSFVNSTILSLPRTRAVCLSATLLLGAAFSDSLMAQSDNAQGQSAESVIVVKPLFDYPVAPESLGSLEEKSEWVVEHFWDALDTKTKGTVDQHALNDAFQVWISPMRWSDANKVAAATDALLKRLEKNPPLLIQFTKAAEDNLYDVNRASMLIDEVYVKFADAMARNKKIDNVRKIRYKEQAKKLKATMPGETAPKFHFKNTAGEEKEYFPMSTFTIIEFGDPTCDDCRMAKLKMDVNLTLSELIEKGKVNIMFILPEEREDWETELAGYPERWKVGASEEVDDIYDIRLTPTFYTIGSDGKIKSKNITVERAINEAIESAK